MYEVPTHAREHVVKVRLNDDELAVVDALARYNQRQRATFLRELVMSTVSRLEAERSAEPKAA